MARAMFCSMVAEGQVPSSGSLEDPAIKLALL